MIRAEVNGGRNCPLQPTMCEYNWSIIGELQKMTLSPYQFQTTIIQNPKCVSLKCQVVVYNNEEFLKNFFI